MVDKEIILIRDSFGKVIRDTRHEHGLTLRKLSRMTGVSIGYISEIERGVKDPSSEMLEDLCGGLGLTAADLCILAARELVA